VINFSLKISSLERERERLNLVDEITKQNNKKDTINKEKIYIGSRSTIITLNYSILPSVSNISKVSA